jgi:antitoxin VapB
MKLSSWVVVLVACFLAAPAVWAQSDCTVGKPEYPSFLDQTLSKVVTRSDLESEIQAKLERVHHFLEEHKLRGVLLTQGCNIDWITGGLADSHVVLANGLGAVSLFITDDGGRYVLGDRSEVARVVNEDLPGLGFQARSYYWYEDKTIPDRKLQTLGEIARGREIGTDVPYANLRLIDSQFAPLRYQLTEPEITKYRWLGHNSAEAVIEVCKALQPGMTERQIEAMASCALMRRGIFPTVLLIGVDDRVFNYFHHLPTDSPLSKYAIVNVCARKWGLIVSVARFVHFGPVPADLVARQKATEQVSAEYEAHTIPGVKAGEMLEMAKKWFAENGFPGHWQDHHQGGAIGYEEREWIAVPGSKEVIHDHQAFAWNPIVEGTLSFDTIIAYKNHIENITATKDWPANSVKINGKLYQMPGILIR